MNIEISMRQAELLKIEAEIAALNSESAKLQSEAAKLKRETGWYPMIAGSSLTLAIIAVVKLFL